MMIRASLLVATLIAFGSAVLAQSQSGAHAGQPAPGQGPVPHPLVRDGDVDSALNETLHMVSHVASFKIVPKGPELPHGRLEFSFAGTVLVDGLKPGSTLRTSGSVEMQYENKEHGRQVFFGRGKITIIGTFRACQWFGKDLDFSFTGSGIVRVIAEFDKNLDTGQFWFDPAHKNPLQVSMIPIPVPMVSLGPVQAITREEFEQKQKRLGG